MTIEGMYDAVRGVAAEGVIIPCFAFIPAEERPEPTPEEAHRWELAYLTGRVAGHICLRPPAGD